MNDLIAGIFGIVDNQVSNIVQILLTILYCLMIRKFSITSYATARFGLLVLGLVLFLNLLGWDKEAGFFAQYSLILLIIAASQQLYHCLNSTNLEKV